MIKKILVILSLIAYRNFASAMEKPEEQKIQNLIYVCYARVCCVREPKKSLPCNAEFAREGLLKRHLREKHSISPKHVERYSRTRCPHKAQ